MKKAFEKLKFLLIAAIFTAAVMFALSFFTCGSVSGGKSAISTDSVTLPAPLQMPLRQSKIQGRLLRNASASVSSNRNESASNPPINRYCSAWFERTYVEFCAIKAASIYNFYSFFLQKNLENSIIVRAGPFRFSVTA